MDVLSPKSAFLSLSPDLGNGTTIYTGARVVNRRTILDSSASLPSLGGPIIEFSAAVVGSGGASLPKHATSGTFLSVPQPLPWSKWKIPWNAVGAFTFALIP